MQTLKSLTYMLALVCAFIVFPSQSIAEMSSGDKKTYRMKLLAPEKHEEPSPYRCDSDRTNCKVQYYESQDGKSSLVRFSFLHLYSVITEYSAFVMSENSEFKYAGLDFSIQLLRIYPDFSDSYFYLSPAVELGIKDEDINIVAGGSLEAGIRFVPRDNLSIFLSVRGAETTEHELNNVLYGTGLAWRF